jgi:hypothetical protein
MIDKPTSAGRGRPKRQERNIGYIIVDDNIRIRVTEDSLIVQEKMGKDKPKPESDIETDSDPEDATYWSHYFTSWRGVLDWLIRHYTTEKISKKLEWTFKEAKDEIIKTTNEVVDLLLGGIDKAMEEANLKVKQLIKKY